MTTVINVLRVDHLRPFAEPTRLVRVYLHVSWVTVLKDGPMRELTRWWPALEELMIMGHYKMVTGCSLSALEGFAAHCLLLRAVTIPVDGRNVPDVEGDMPRVKGDAEEDIKPWSRCSRQFITVCGGRAPSPDRVAAYLHSLFPCLRSRL